MTLSHSIFKYLAWSDPTKYNGANKMSINTPLGISRSAILTTSLTLFYSEKNFSDLFEEMQI